MDANKCLHAQADMVKKSFHSGIANNLDGSENRLVRVPAELPSFKITYGSSTSNETESDPFQTSEDDDSNEEYSASEESN